MSIIRSLETELITVRLPRPWGVDVLENHFVAVVVEDDTGATGHGFSWTPTIGPRAVRALLDDDIHRLVVGGDSDPATVWDALWPQLHEAGSGGITTIAMAGLDLALWDLRARRAGVSVPALLGIRRRCLPTYGSGVNRHLALPELLEQVRRWLDAGQPAVKIKVGGRPLDEDIERVAAVRGILGDSRDLMVDANQLWKPEEAIAAARVLGEFSLRWLEEPLRADDLAGYRALAEATAVPLAAGENLHTVHRFIEFMDAGVLAIAQPNVVRVGGITPFLHIAAAASVRGVAIYPHLLPELSAQLAMCLPEATLIEDVEDASLTALDVLAEPAAILIDHATARLIDRAGLGLTIRTEQ